MKKDLVTHFIYMLSLFILIAVYKGWLELSYLPFLLGGIFGTFLPDVDYLIYVYFLKPNEMFSQQVVEFMANKNFLKGWSLLVENRSQRVGLIFHSALFQVIFLLFAFLIVTSSGSLLGRGIVLAFSLHLFIDQLVDYMENKNVDNWFVKFPFNLDREQKIWFMVGNLFFLFIIAFFF